MTRSPVPTARVVRTLDVEELEVLRRMLEQQRSFRTDQLAQLRAEVSGSRPRPVDREINDSLAAGARAALHDVLDALRRMQAGCYGTCAECAGPIELERLEILPQVALCMRCQRTAAEPQ
jgi:RNA polymerase-binding transcription factor DksA